MIVCGTAKAYNGTPNTARVASVTLKESILFAFDRDPSISQQAAQMGIGQAQIDEARSGWMPQIS
ncbi:TolC family outer membrane protein, partial [Escherichia coli]